MTLKDVKEKHVRWIGIPVLGIFLSFLFCEKGYPTIGETLKTVTITLIFWHGTFSVLNFFRNKFPEIENTSRRLAFSAMGIIIYVIIADTLFRKVFDFFFPDLIWEVENLAAHWAKSIFISFLVSMIYEMFYFYTGWNQSKLETQKLKTQQVASQLETLKNQISPHFLFNSLNTLAAIIPEDQNSAVKFTEKLSEVYRYILSYKDKELVPLETELDFIESYLYLLKMRYPENLFVEYKIEEKDKKMFVAPLTLQMLVENAIKHNVISKSKPLTIEIYTDSQKNIVVKNQLQKKVIGYNSTRTGLDNIKKRYKYLSHKTIEIIDTNTSFIVSIPLIQLSDH